MNATPSHALPARAVLRETGLHVALVDISPAQLQDPFLQDTLQRVPAAQSLLHVTDPESVAPDPASAPAGLIFHVARCGSTLVSQLLKSQPGLTVYSEPLALNELLVPPHPASRERLVGSLRVLGRLVSQHARGPYVLKLSSWNLLYCDVVAEAFPQSPWALCIRDPLEVCVSLVARPPVWLRDLEAGPLAPVFRSAGFVRESQERRAARVFGALCEAAERLNPRRGVLVSYPSLPSSVWTEILPHFGSRADDPAIGRMLAASRMHSKARPGEALPFTSDNQAKQATASAELRRAVDELARPALARLQAAVTLGKRD